jgi:Ca2+-binding EF-hand superfamily protein
MRWSVSPVVLAVLMAATVASGQPPPTDLQSVFKKADKNNDGHLDRLEFMSAQTEVFFLTDGDKDGYLTVIEIRRFGPLDQKNFDAADRDRDGKLSMDEFLGAVSKDFDQADKDGNGRMTFDELMGAMQPK